MSLRVVKLGGSLLDLPDLAQRWRGWLVQQPAAATVLVVGGGALADAIRRAQRLHNFDDASAHRLCLKAMEVTARLVCEILPEARFCGDESEIDCGALGSVQVCDTRRSVFAANVCGELPESWDVTSDSIAAQLALSLVAEELVLLKSTSPQSIGSVEELAAAEFVDRYFPQAMRRYWSQARLAGKNQARVRLVNLRDEHFAEVTLLETLN